jgi:hypothetical protein
MVDGFTRTRRSFFVDTNANPSASMTALNTDCCRRELLMSCPINEHAYRPSAMHEIIASSVSTTHACSSVDNAIKW